jgi:hypothetical protein
VEADCKAVGRFVHARPEPREKSAWHSGHRDSPLLDGSSAVAAAPQDEACGTPGPSSERRSLGGEAVSQARSSWRSPRARLRSPPVSALLLAESLVIPPASAPARQHWTTCPRGLGRRRGIVYAGARGRLG